MRILRALRLRVRSLLHRDAVDQELDAELQFYIDHEIDRRTAAGSSPETARLAALRSLGGLTRVTEECRDARGLALPDGLLREVGYAGRVLRKSPAYTAAVVASLALGIRATTVVFSVMHGVLLNPYPYRGAERMVRGSPVSGLGCVSQS